MEEPRLFFKKIWPVQVLEISSIHDYFYNICIFLLISDLKRNLLVIGSTGTETPFLAESELPECARLSNRQMEGKSASELEDQQLAEALAKRYKNSSNDMYIFQEKFFCKRQNFVVSELNIYFTLLL